MYDKHRKQDDKKKETGDGTTDGSHKGGGRYFSHSGDKASYNLGDRILDDYSRRSESAFTPLAIKSVYQDALHDMGEFRTKVIGKKAPAKNMMMRAGGFLKSLFVDRKGILDRMEEKKKVMAYCISDVGRLKNVAQRSYSQLVQVVNSNYDELLEISSVLPSMKEDASELKHGIRELSSSRDQKDISSREAVELGKQLFLAENAYRNKVNQIRHICEEADILSNFLRRNKAYSTSLVNMVGFYERAYLLGRTILSQIDSHINSLHSGAQILQGAKELDAVAGEVMGLANNADELWTSEALNLMDSSDNLESKLYDGSRTKLMDSGSDIHAMNVENIISSKEEELEAIFREA